MIHMEKINIKKLKHLPIKKKTIQTNLRIAVIAILGIIVIVSAYGAYATYQQPTTTEESVPIIEYAHTGTFNYIVYLKDNTVYNTSILYPGQGNIFKKITDYINTSLAYRFFCDQPADIDGTYELIAQIQTDMWEKEYVIIPQSAFSSTNSKQASFNADFSINHTSFEDIVYQINDETGVTAQDTTLIMKFDIDITAETTNGVISESFTPSLNVSLGGNIIEIKGDLSQYSSGVLEETEEIVQPGSIEQSISWGLTSIVFLIILAVFLMFIKSDEAAFGKTDKRMRKILKKYGEWIVETEKLPTIEDAKIVPMKSLDDLVKISEELGKPIIYVTSDKDKKHTFYVFDEAMSYQYILLKGEQLKKITSCPKCGTKVTCNGAPGQKTIITCPSCGNKGTVTFEETRKPFFSFKK